MVLIDNAKFHTFTLLETVLEAQLDSSRLHSMGPAETWKLCSSESKDSCFCYQPHLVISAAVTVRC